MRKVAFISDIHSNLPALEGTLKDIKSKGIDEVYCLGDIIGYHCNPNEVIKLLKDNCVISIKGNHDKVIAEEDFDSEIEGNFVLSWNSSALTKENRAYLNNLPETLELNIESKTIQIVHGSPDSIDQYIREGSDEAEYFLENMTTDILISGHTHIPYVVKKDNKLLLNTGSIGKPKFGKPECSYIVLSFNDGEAEPKIITLPYDVKTITDDLSRHSFPDKYIVALESGLA